ncbi:MAG TPA: hypothetical protein VJH92_00995 [Candidatus Nanoarchaeia archaeon]|nr:hypothetical protein [Candidatus Nanoarchaeia archaeon]
MGEDKVYRIDYQNIIIFNDKPLRPSYFEVVADRPSEAAKKAVPELIRNPAHMDVYNATVVGPSGRKYEILRKGSWLINTNTGKKLENISDS